MPDVESSLDFLADLDLYKSQRPYIFTPSLLREQDVDLSKSALNTVQLHDKTVTIRDVRDHEDSFLIGEVGFEVVKHSFCSNDFQLFATSKLARDDHRAETRDFLKDKFNAEEVACYSVKLRYNGDWDPDEVVDLTTLGFIEPPAKGVHDFTFEYGPKLIIEKLKAAGLEKYLVPGYRFRILNTWRPLVPVLEDNPLAFCDTRSVDPQDLVISDRVLPNEYFTTYYVKHNQKQRWHWISNQTPSEVTLLMMFDTQPGPARYCCHGSFQNPLAHKGAPVRQSIETRSIIITKD